jgi:hypothetical protein
MAFAVPPYFPGVPGISVRHGRNAGDALGSDIGALSGAA